MLAIIYFALYLIQYPIKINYIYLLNRYRNWNSYICIKSPPSFNRKFPKTQIKSKPKSRVYRPKITLLSQIVRQTFLKSLIRNPNRNWDLCNPLGKQILFHTRNSNKIPGQILAKVWKTNVKQTARNPN